MQSQAAASKICPKLGADCCCSKASSFSTLNSYLRLFWVETVMFSHSYSGFQAVTSFVDLQLSTGAQVGSGSCHARA